MTNRILYLGRIVAPHGLKGAIKVATSGEFLKSYKKGFAIALYSAESQQDGLLINAKYLSRQKIRSIAQGTSLIILETDECNNRNESEALAGLNIGMPLDEAKQNIQKLRADGKLSHDDIYLFEYLDLDVYDFESEKKVGTVDHVYSNEPAEWLVVNLIEADQIMVPLASPSIQKIDFKKNRIVLTQWEDLKEE